MVFEGDFGRVFDLHGAAPERRTARRLPALAEPTSP